MSKTSKNCIPLKQNIVFIRKTQHGREDDVTPKLCNIQSMPKVVNVLVPFLIRFIDSQSLLNIVETACIIIILALLKMNSCNVLSFLH